MQTLLIEKLGDGAAICLVNEAIQEALKNCKDINADEKAREVTLKLSLKPNQDRNQIDLSYGVTTKNRPFRAIQTVVNVGKTKDGVVEAAEMKSQLSLFDELESKIVNIK